jgi:hypothetical protein
MGTTTKVWLAMSVVTMLVGCGDDGATPDASAGSGGATSSAQSGGSAGEGGDADTVPPSAELVFPVAGFAQVPSGSDYPVIASGSDDRAVGRIEVLIDDEVALSGEGAPTLWREAPEAAGGAGAVSEQVVEEGGFVEFTVSGRRTQKVVGLGGPDRGASAEDVEYGFYFTPSGSFQGALGSGQYGFGDVFRIERSGGMLRSYQNGREISAIALDDDAPLYLDTWLASPGASISQATISTAGEAATAVVWVNHIGTRASLALAFAWDTTTTRDGPHSFAARVVDEAGNAAESSAVVRPVDNTAPLCTLDAPAANAVVSGTVELSGTASDANLFTLAFFADGSLLSQHDGQVVAATNWNTTLVANGAHVLRAQAYDYGSNVSLPCEVTVSVSN